MPRYIDVSLYEDCRIVCNSEDKGVPVKDIPTADVQEVRHGKWIGYPSITISKRRRTVQSIIYKCSCCGKSNGRAKSPYCKNCGALMDGKEAEAKIKEVKEKE